MLDTLLQSSLVELFQAYDVALAPLPRGSQPGATPDQAASIAFASVRGSSGPTATGKLTLGLPGGVFEIMKNNGAYSTRQGDWTRELVNQLMGRFKNRLLAYGFQLQAGLPTSLGRETLNTRLQKNETEPRTYRARTLRGDIVALLEGSLKETDLVYRGASSDASEGDLIIF
jgi:hypothetical protein